MASPVVWPQPEKMLLSLLVEEEKLLREEEEEDAARKKLTTVVLLTAALILCDDDDATAKRVLDEVRLWGGSRLGRKYSVPKWVSHWVNIEGKLATLNTANWKAHFGVSKELFSRLVSDLTPALRPRSAAFRHPVPPSLSVAVALVRFRFGHSFSVCASWFGIGYATARNCVLEVMGAIPATYGDVIKLPTGQDLKEDLRLMELKGLPQCGWALDGTEVPVRARATEVVAKRNRKGIVSDKVLLMVNDNLVIRFAQIGMAGSNGDGRAFAYSTLQAAIQEGTWPPSGFEKEILGVSVPPQVLIDAAFPATNNTVKPFSGDTTAAAEMPFFGAAAAAAALVVATKDARSAAARFAFSRARAAT